MTKVVLKKIVALPNEIVAEVGMNGPTLDPFLGMIRDMEGPQNEMEALYETVSGLLGLCRVIELMPLQRSQTQSPDDFACQNEVRRVQDSIHRFAVARRCPIDARGMRHPLILWTGVPDDQRSTILSPISRESRDTGGSYRSLYLEELPYFQLVFSTLIEIFAQYRRGHVSRFDRYSEEEKRTFETQLLNLSRQGGMFDPLHMGSEAAKYFFSTPELVAMQQSLRMILRGLCTAYIMHYGKFDPIYFKIVVVGERPVIPPTSLLWWEMYVVSRMIHLNDHWPTPSSIEDRIFTLNPGSDLVKLPYDQIVLRSNNFGNGNAIDPLFIWAAPNSATVSSFFERDVFKESSSPGITLARLKVLSLKWLSKIKSRKELTLRTPGSAGLGKEAKYSY